MNFQIPTELAELQERTRRFIAEQVIPLERSSAHSSHGPSAELRSELIARARSAGLLTPHASLEMGGLGLSHLAKAVVFEEAGYSWLGPTALNIHAPDEGNIHLMGEVATTDQQERWLRPQVEGRIRSCFAMTEPGEGAGSDPSMLSTSAIRDGDDYLINGRKWFITGADGADYCIVMARMEDGSATIVRALNSFETWRQWTRVSSADTASCTSRTCASQQRMCSVKSARGSGTPRFGSRRRA